MVTTSRTWAFALSLLVPLLTSPSQGLVVRQDATGPQFVYRGDKRHPDRIKAAGGFAPNNNGSAMIDDSFELWHHQLGKKPTAYVSTSSAFEVAHNHSSGYMSTTPGWVYLISTTANMIELTGSTIGGYHERELEYSALGGILYDQIKGWIMTPPVDCYATPELCKSYDEFARLTNTAWTMNPDYNPRYDALRPSGPQLQLVWPERRERPLRQGEKEEDMPVWPSERPDSDTTYRQAAVAFMNQHGAEVGWDGEFPLKPLRK